METKILELQDVDSELHSSVLSNIQLRSGASLDVIRAARSKVIIRGSADAVACASSLLAVELDRSSTQMATVSIVSTSSTKLKQPFRKCDLATCWACNLRGSHGHTWLCSRGK
ncbi:unnamed protein product [Symbiodinium natans]|uniref:Uncharacterized protein n=1 Tax=Symbiodinium natans TaxID=878477 RepID=A0A812RIL1_9DINO|nr:unnamed protein product [Symbiodinium natans]